jgi:mono/diheme cytochrome c family protein
VAETGRGWDSLGTGAVKLGLAISMCLAVTMAGCGLSMTQQRKFKPYEPTTVWKDGTSARPLPDGVVAQGDLARDEVAENPPPATAALLERGRERFGIYCAPCHGLSGYGDGIIVKHGFPAPPSYHLARLRSAPGQELYDAIKDGYGVMYSYAARVEPRDRWAIVAYIRALQLSQDAKLADVPEAREKLQ